MDSEPDPHLSALILAVLDPDLGACKLTKINKYGTPGFLPIKKAPVPS